MSAEVPEHNIGLSRWSRAALATAISSLLLVFFVSQVNIERGWQIISGAQPGWLVASLVMTALVMAVRGLRFAILAEKSPLPVVIGAVTLQNFFNRITPLKLGELSLPYLLHRHGAEPIALSVVNLLLVRLIELCLVIGLVIVSLWMTSVDVDVWMLLGLGLFTGFILVFFGRLLTLVVSLMRRLVHAFDSTNDSRLGRIVEQISNTLERRERMTLGRHLSLVFLTLSVVFLNQLAFDFLLRAFGFNLPFLHIIIGVSLTQLAGAVPLPTLGTVGAHEAGWVIGFMAVGMSQSDAILTGVASQFVSLFFNAVLAGPAYLSLRGRRGDQSSGEANR